MAKIPVLLSMVVHPFTHYPCGNVHHNVGILKPLPIFTAAAMHMTVGYHCLLHPILELLEVYVAPSNLLV